MLRQQPVGQTAVGLKQPEGGSRIVHINRLMQSETAEHPFGAIPNKQLRLPIGILTNGCQLHRQCNVVALVQ